MFRELSIKHYFYISILLLSMMPFSSRAVEVTSNDVYTQIYQINEEVNFLKHFFNITQTAQAPEMKAVLLPRHTWQKTYEILYKINIFRQKVGLPFVAVPSREPIQEVTHLHVYEQSLRILTELNLLKFYLGIQDKVASPPAFSGKTVTDNFNLLSHISYQIDLLNGTEFNPSAVFGQAMRIYEDVNTLVEALEIKDDTTPSSKKANSLPADSLAMALQLLQEIKRIQNLAGVEAIDVYAFNLQKNITPTEVFGITGIVLAELQTIKAYLGLKHAFTPLANFYYDKTPGDVIQMLGWSLKKLQLIQSLN